MASKFSPESDKLILGMRAAGNTFAEILVAVVATGMVITEAAIRHRWRWISMTPSQREARKNLLNARRRKQAAAHVVSRQRLDMTEHVVCGPKLTPAMLRELHERQSLAPRNLTAALCGDPLPGYSALDRRA